MIDVFAASVPVRGPEKAVSSRHGAHHSSSQQLVSLQLPFSSVEAMTAPPVSGAIVSSSPRVLAPGLWPQLPPGWRLLIAQAPIAPFVLASSAGHPPAHLPFFHPSNPLWPGFPVCALRLRRRARRRHWLPLQGVAPPPGHLLPPPSSCIEVALK